MTRKVALITGVTGQDGAYLSQLLLDKGYVVHGIKRRSSSFNTQRVDHLYVDPHERETRFHLHYGDMTDATNLIRIVQETQPEVWEAYLSWVFVRNVIPGLPKAFQDEAFQYQSKALTGAKEDRPRWKKCVYCGSVEARKV